ncbi:hypothetical protein LJU02_05420 [Corynebacterium pseudotuberculosis]|uniref:Integral membrane protein n=1 Tax=Corynebacterium pseudotuberculosis 258 TaxID=1168865 RepID=A0AAU8Q7B3_CORPS|nr:hypothetical protein [Corynebacterium pseudotuberculosis]AER69107.1 Hypothetical protein Cp106_1038 [Corynebacterium pseudotuberculosis 1/06-A]AEQ06610.1 hypothetical protein CPCIP5297_05495 [Corynebacterium pseudotuberculosis CIP 52.97]AFB72408.1 hypothetical protein CP316_05475 [Corynebacterium pseudotuberculosis 316]AFH90881.2 hypothetical protein CP31_05705 [Corynebacterium pseudotuberculosis 31]AFK16704.1 hypothetical protein CP258_05490 [Corynebacterium pseudotuberculosis 258]
MPKALANHPTSATIPVGLRVGGAFVAIAFVLFIFTFVQIATVGWMEPVAVTARFLLIILAAGIFGGFATIRKEQAASRLQIGALIVALAFVIAGRFLSPEPIFVWQQYWLPIYGFLALVCGFVARQSAIR